LAGSKEILNLYYSTSWESEEDLPEPSQWSKGLVVKQLEVMHGQWLYRNVQIQGANSGALAIAKKKELQKAIEDEGLARKICTYWKST
jgi:hypothetical protein